MKIAVVLSGSVRLPANSLASLEWFNGHDVSVFIHTWRDIANLQNESFSKRPNDEPSPQIIHRYNPALLVSDSWDVCRHLFLANLDRWKADNLVVPEVNNIGMHGMFFSLKRAFDTIDNMLEYDVVLRLRFDCKILDNPIPYMNVSGWTIPEGNDFFGLNDQLGWFVPYKDDAKRSIMEAQNYFSAYNRMDYIIRKGIPHGPEAVLAESFRMGEVSPNRIPLRYTIWE